MVTVTRGTRDTSPSITGTGTSSSTTTSPTTTTTPTTSTPVVVDRGTRDTATVTTDGNGNLVVVPPLTSPGLETQPVVTVAKFAFDLNLGAAEAGGITAPGSRALGGGGTRIRMLGPGRSNSDANSIWFRFKSTWATTGRIDWVLLPPNGADSSIVTVESSGQEIYFPIPTAGLYKLVATARDNNGQTLSSYTQFAVTLDPSSSVPFDTSWTGSTAVTITPPTDPGTPIVVTPVTTDPVTGVTTPTTPVVVTPTTPVALGTARNYSSVAQSVKLAAACNAVATQITVDSTSGLPTTAPYTLLLDYGTSQEEIVTVTAFSGTALTVKRGEDGTGATAHAAGAEVRHGLTARDLREPQLHITAGAGVHGVSGNVVGTTDAQTLSGKTMDGGLNTFKNIPPSALTGNVATTDSTQEFANKILDGSKNQFKNVPASALTGADGFLTPTSTATLSNKTIDGSINTFKSIPYSALTGVPSSSGGAAAVSPKHWYLNGYAWIIWTTPVSDSRALQLFDMQLGNVPAGIVQVSLNWAVGVTTDCRVDLTLQAGARGTWPTRRHLYYDGTAFGTTRVDNLGGVANFYWAGGNLSVRAFAQKVAGAGGWFMNSGAPDTYCEVAWFPMTEGDTAATNIATASTI